MTTTDAGQLAVALVVDREAIISEWERRVLADSGIPTARTLSVGELRDYIPKFLEHMATEARSETAAINGTGITRVHARLRLEAGYSLDEALAELEHLRDALTSLVRSEPARPGAMIIAVAFSEAFAAVAEVFG